MSREMRILKKPISLWLVSLALLAIAFEGVLSFPGIVKSSESILQFAVSVAHALYAVSAIAIITGLWFSLKATPALVIIWGISSLGAAIGGPIAFSRVNDTFSKTAALMVLLIFLITAGLFIYTRHIIRKGQRINN